MSVRRSIFVAGAIVFGAVLSAYLFLHSLWTGASQTGGKLSVADACTDDALSEVNRVNPNKMLFISCGGFLD